MSAREHLSRMTLREKCAQRVFCDFRFDEPDYERVMHLVKKVGIGGVRVSGGTVFDVAPLVNSLQRVSKLPLLVAADYGDGAGDQVRGATAFPPAMALGAAGSEELAQAKGRLVAREAVALGVRWVLAPVVDPASSPGAGTRSFGDDPSLVARLSRAFLAGLREMRAMGCLRGRAGPGPLAELARDAEAVMGAAPAREPGFEGLAAAVGSDPVPGADLILSPEDPEGTVDALEREVFEGRLSDAEAYRSAERVLAAKQRLGLFGERITDQSRVEQIAGAPSHREAARRMAEQAVTLVGGTGRLPSAVALLETGDAGVFRSELASRIRIEDGAETVVAALAGPDPGAAASALRAAAARHRALVVVAFGAPSLLEGSPEGAMRVASYGADDASQRAAARALAGEIPYAGKLPVKLGA